MSYEMESEDFTRQQRAEIAMLNEEIHRLRMDLDAKDREIAALHTAGVELSRQNLELRKTLQSWADDADETIRRARQVEAEALEL